jgi:Family of unknown function (DUF5309)
MAVPTGTVQTFAQNNVREQLFNTINLLDAYETPFYSSIGNDTAKTRTPEWLSHTAPAVNPSNAQVEGADATNVSATVPTRWKNVCQILDKAVQVSDTTQAVEAAGMKELARQLLLEGISLRTDIENAMAGNQASILGNATTAGQMASAEAFIASNSSGGTGYVNGGFNSGTGLVAAATDGTQRTFTETILKTSILNAWTKGGKNLTVLVGGAQKQVASQFAGIATKYNLANGNSSAGVTIYGAADLYVSDFGHHRILPGRFNRNRTALVLDFALWKKLWLQPIQQKDLAVNGHSIRKLLWAECTLQCINEAGNAKCADLL